MAKKLKSLNPIIGTGYKTLSKIKDGEDGNIENFPDTLPKIPRLSYKRLGVSGLEIGWEFEDKIYYTYELYGSTTKGFEASEENLMFQGLASSYFYEAKPGEKWYFKARAKNTHGRYTEFSSELVTYTVKLDNLGEYVEGGSINGALIENATINNAHIKDLHADKITAGILDADRIGANSITANKIEANAITSEKIQANAITSGKIQANAITTDKLAANIIASNHIQSGTITSGHIQSGTIESDHIKSNSINSNHIQANTIQSEHIQTGAITAGSGIIAEGAIGSAQISSLDAAKIEAGTIDTSKVTIQGADGHLRLKGNRMQVFQGTGNQARERVSLGDVNGNGSVYGLRVRGADGTTILLDENGVKSEGITDGAITNDKISDDANIDGAKLNINSVVNKINEDGTETIQGTKIEVDGTTLNTKLSTITTKQTEDSERITQAQSQITANTNAIKLKVDEQTYTTDKRDMTSKLEKNTSEISAMKGKIALKVEQTDIENAKSEMEGVIDTKVDSAKAEIKVTTDAISQNVSNLSQTVSTKADGSTVTTLSNKVGSLETSVNGISGKVSSLETTTTTINNKANDAISVANTAKDTADKNKTSINSINGEITAVKSNMATLDVNLQGITQRVSSTESTTATISADLQSVSNVANNANSKVDNLQIGATNLLKNTKDLKNWGQSGGNISIAEESYKGLTVQKQFGDWAYKYVSTNLSILEVGKEYTASVYLKCTGTSPTVYFTPSSNNGLNGNGTDAILVKITDRVTTDWKRYSVTFTVTNNYKLDGNINMRVESSGYTNGSALYVAGIKLEKGNKATDWTPAPEDVDGAINSVDSKVDTLRTEYNSTKSKVATLETDLDGITQRVSSTETTTSSLTSQINNKENKNDRVIYAKGNGNDAPNNSQVKVGSNTLVNGHGRGLNILALNPTTLEQYYNGTFDTYGGDNYKTQFAEKIQELNNGNYIIVVTSHDSACLNYATVCDALYLIGGSAPNTSISSYREAYALIGKSKLGKGNGLEMYIPKTATDTRVAEVSVKVSDQGALLGVNSNNSESKIDTLTTRVSSAESKLTKDSLTTTIGNHYTTSNDVNGIVTSKGYATTSEVKQTTNELTATFKGSGGYNLLYNGNFKRSFEKWTNTGATIANNLSCPQNQTGILLSGALTTTKHCVQSVNMETLKPFTVSFWQYTSSAGSDGATNPYRASQITITYSDNTKTYHSTGHQTVFDTWELRSITIKPTKRVANINVELWNRDTTKSVYYTNVMLEYGSIYTEWSPNPNEVYDGVTTIDKDGIKVSQSNYNGYTQMKADGFYVNNGSENVISVTSSGATFKGKVTIQSGSSVPTSTLSGTISSNQLNSSITSDINNAKNNASSALSTANTAKSTADTAKSTADSAKSTATSAQSTANTANTNATNALNTANSVNSTVNSNKDNWSNAYNRVKEWASGAVTGTTNINGGMIATNTITANKMAIADFTNYCEMNVDNCSTYGFTKTTDSSESNNYWMKLNSLNRDIAVTSKKNYEMYKGNVQGTYRIFFEFNSTVKGATTSGGTDSVLRPIGVGLYCKDLNGNNAWHIVSCSSFTSGANKTYSGTVTLGSNIVSFGVYVQIEGHAPFTGQLLIRNIKVNKMANGELIVDGAITADKIASRVINADKIVSGTITSNEIKAGTITATQMAANSVTADKIAAGAITANKIASGAITATMITSGTLDASKVNVTNLNASNIKSGKLSANYIDATNLSVKGELLSGQINGIGGMKFADGAIISSYDSHVHGYKGIQISAPSIKLGDKVDIYSPTLISTVTGKSSTSSTSSSWTMSSSGGLNCSTINTSSTTTIGGSLNVRNNMINGMNNLQMGRGSVYIPIFGSSSNFDYIKGGRGTIAFADSGPIHFIYNGTKSSFIAGGSVYLPHAGSVNCDHFRLGAGIIASPSSGSFHFLTANGATSPLYAGILYSATRMSLDEPMVVSSNSVFDKINSIDVIETKDGLRLYNPIQTTKAIDKSTEVVKTEYDEDKNEINTSIDYTSAIATLWKAVQELKQENNELKEIIKDIHSKL